MKTTHYLLGAALLLATGCKNDPGRPPEPMRAASLSLTELLHVDTSQSSAALAELGRYRDEWCLQGDSIAIAGDPKTLDRLGLSGDLKTDSSLTFRCAAIRLGTIRSRDEFQDQVGANLDAFDTALAMLGERVTGCGQLEKDFDQVLETLTHLRNEVAVRIAKTANTPDEDYQETRDGLVSAFGRLEILLDVAELAIDRAGNEASRKEEI